MSRKLPSGVVVSCDGVMCADGSGYEVSVRDRDGHFLVKGVAENTTRKSVREAAWVALEQVGLVVDE